MKIIEKSKFYEDLSVGFQMCEELWKFWLWQGSCGRMEEFISSQQSAQ